MSARDELALDIFLADNARQPEAEALVDWEASLSITASTTYAHGIADGITAKGYRKLRTITTAEELAALPEGPIVMADWGDAPAHSWAVGNLGQPRNITAELPATVLHEPDAEATR